MAIMKFLYKYLTFHINGLEKSTFLVLRKRSNGDLLLVKVYTVTNLKNCNIV